MATATARSWWTSGDTGIEFIARDRASAYAYADAARTVLPGARQVWRELRARGFTGGHSVVRGAFAQLRGDTPGDGRLHGVAAAVRRVVRPSTWRACAWALGWDKLSLARAERDDRRRFVQKLCSIEPAVAQPRSLAHQFIGLVRRRDPDSFDRWMLQASAFVVPEMRRFASGVRRRASGLRADLSAVPAAFSSPWSSGQVEGQINRLGYLERQPGCRSFFHADDPRRSAPRCQTSSRQNSKHRR